MPNCADPKTPREIDQLIIDLVHRQGALDEELGRWLLLARRARVHRHFGFAAFGDYVAARLGVTPRLAKERAAVAEALESLPVLRGALIAGTRSWSAVRELSRVATPTTESAWLTASEGKNLREVEGLVSGRRPGDDPQAPRDPLLTPHRAVFVLNSDQRAATLEALSRARRILGPETTDGAALAFLCEDFLGRRRNLEEGAGYQVSLTLCAECQSAHRPVAGELLPVSDAFRDCALCDPELVGLRPACSPAVVAPLDDGGAAPSSTVLSSTEGEASPLTPVGRTDGAASRVPHVGRAEVAASRTPSVGPRPHQGAHQGGASTLPPSASATSPASPHRAALADLLRRGGLGAVLQETSRALGLHLHSVTPKLRRLVLARDHHRCVVPGCTRHLFIDLHHLKKSRDGGSNTPDNLITLCSTHHRLHHEGYLGIEGTPSHGLVFHCPRGKLRTEPAHPNAA